MTDIDALITKYEHSSLDGILELADALRAQQEEIAQLSASRTDEILSMMESRSDCALRKRADEATEQYASMSKVARYALAELDSAKLKHREDAEQIVSLIHERDALRQDALRVAGERMGDDAYIEGLTQDAERYRFLRSPLASEYGIVQKEFWEEFAFKLCREEQMDKLVDGAMQLLRHHIAARAKEQK